MSQVLRILIVDDQVELATSLSEFLEVNGHEADFAYSGMQCLELVQHNEYDVIVLDVGMPKMDGWQVCEQLRQQLYLDTPIIFLTARGDLDDKRKGFESGADDYLIKPFAPEELLMRLIALTARGRRSDVSMQTFGDLTLHPDQQKVSRQGQTIELSRIEYQLLLLLIRHTPKPVSKNEIIHTLWPDSDGSMIRTHMYRLRNALDKPFATPLIKTMHGRGYCFVQNDL